MEIKITSSDLEVTKSLNDYVENKLERIAKYFKEAEMIVDVTFKVEKASQIADFRVKVNHELYHANTDSDDLYSSIDKNIDVLEGQIRKAKTIKEKHQKDGSLKDIINSNQDTSFSVENEITKTAYYDLKPLSPEDAMLILQEKTTQSFLTFINIETGKVNVLYKLNDQKNFGIVIPQD